MQREYFNAKRGWNLIEAFLSVPISFFQFFPKHFVTALRSFRSQKYNSIVQLFTSLSNAVSHLLSVSQRHLELYVMLVGRHEMSAYLTGADNRMLEVFQSHSTHHFEIEDGWEEFGDICGLAVEDVQAVGGLLLAAMIVIILVVPLVVSFVVIIIALVIVALVVTPVAIVSAAAVAAAAVGVVVRHGVRPSGGSLLTTTHW